MRTTHLDDLDGDLPIDDAPADRAWDRAPVLPALGLVLLGLVWLVFLIWPRPPADDSVDAGFLRDMITHHSQAVRMGEIAHDGTRDEAVDTLAGDIVTGQQVQVGVMFGWLEQWGLSPNNDGPAMAWMGTPTDGPMPGMATTAEVANLQTLAGPALDAEFLRLMTAHHVSGADMATVCVASCDDAEVVRLARGIAAAQASEIGLMNEMLVERGQPAVSTDATMAGMEMGGSTGGVVGSSTSETVRSVLIKAVRSLPVLFGLVALSWLIADGVRRRGRSTGDADLPQTALLAGIGAAAVSAALHAGLASGLLDVRTDLGLFQGSVVVVQAAVIGAALAGRSRGVALAGASVGILAIVLWSVLEASTGVGEETGRFDLAITLAIVAEAIQAAALFWAWRRSGTLPRASQAPA